jgi:protein-disulfide isomerase
LEYAEKAELDIEKFKTEMSEHVYASLMNKSLKDEIDSGVEATATSFVNGARYQDSWDLKTFSSVFEKALT